MDFAPLYSFRMQFALHSFLMSWCFDQFSNKATTTKTNNHNSVFPLFLSTFGQHTTDRPKRLNRSMCNIKYWHAFNEFFFFFFARPLFPPITIYAAKPNGLKNGIAFISFAKAKSHSLYPHIKHYKVCDAMELAMYFNLK